MVDLGFHTLLHAQGQTDVGVVEERMNALFEDLQKRMEKRRPLASILLNIPGAVSIGCQVSNNVAFGFLDIKKRTGGQTSRGSVCASMGNNGAVYEELPLEHQNCVTPWHWKLSIRSQMSVDFAYVCVTKQRSILCNGLVTFPLSPYLGCTTTLALCMGLTFEEMT